MKVSLPTIKKTDKGWYIIVKQLGATYTYGPFKKCPKCEMFVYDIKNMKEKG